LIAAMTLAALPAIPPLLSLCSSWSLQLDKFSFRRNGEAEAKTEALKGAIKTYQRSKPQLEKAVQSRQAWLKSLATQHGTRLRAVRLYSTSPLILHLGRASVLENVGLYCERTTGLPLIPGTAVKGVLSTWACWEANQNEDGSFPDPKEWETQRSAYPADHARRIFGSDAESGSENAGEVAFLGACPAAVPALALDIVNPHHEEKNVNGTIIRKTKERLTPSVFLCLEANTAWDFTFLARAGTPDAAALLTSTETWLRECLAQVGLGAKTAAGYGRFNDKPISPGAASTKAVNTADAALQAQAATVLANDYNEIIFKNTVLAKLTPSLLEQLKNEIPKLQKPENAPWLEKLKQQFIGKDAKDLRKRLKEKTWFPQEWLPPQP
jgi:CRISPR type III-B/RAMP module RAMP protein Cmr6